VDHPVKPGDDTRNGVSFLRLAQQLFFALAPQVLRISHVRRAHCSKPMAGVDFGELPTIIVELTAY
jgi:hypothetical protein